MNLLNLLHVAFSVFFYLTGQPIDKLTDPVIIILVSASRGARLGLGFEHNLLFMRVQHIHISFHFFFNVYLCTLLNKLNALATNSGKKDE